MDLIREAKAAHEHLVVASMAMIAHRKTRLQLLMLAGWTIIYKIGKLRESRSYCENALRIYAIHVPGTNADGLWIDENFSYI
uniref:Uncharacterized protein n=1 Tax=Solanum lycopersicum TaxID=4081 RepID=K4BHH8_SOLLC